MDETNVRQLKVFLCHAHSDAAQVRALYARLKADGVDVWLDKESLIPGANWEREIRKAVRDADIVIVCLSKQFNERGFRQKEVRLALDTAMEMPEGEIFIIPARLEECDYLESLYQYHGVDLFEPDGYDRLMRALKLRAGKIGAVLESHKGWLPKFTTPRPKPIGTKKPKPEVKSTAQKAERKEIQNSKFRIQNFFIAGGIVIALLALFFIGRTIFQNLPVSPAPTSIRTSIAATYLPTSIFTPSLPSEMPTLTFTPTATPLPEEIKDAKGIIMRLVPASEFTMGYSANVALADCQIHNPYSVQIINYMPCNLDWFIDEEPIHQVYLDLSITHNLEMMIGNQSPSCSQIL